MIKPIKSIIFLALSGLTVWILSGMFPKIMNFADAGPEKDALIALYWVTIIAIVGIPQAGIWAMEQDVSFITSMKSLGALFLTSIVIVLISVFKTKLFLAITLGDFANIFFNVIYWIVIILCLYVPQHLIYEKELEQA